MAMETKKSKLLDLFSYSLSILFVGMGVMPVLPLYAAELGASPRVTGLYFSIIFTSFLVGTLLTSSISMRIGLRRLFILAGCLGAPALFLMGQATALWQLVILTSVVWFTAAMGLSLVNFFTSIYADMESRGRWFGLISLSSPVGALLGGAIIGWLVDWQGYALMFVATSLVWTIWPVLAFFRLESFDLHPDRTSPQANGKSPPLGAKIPLLVLLSAILLSMLTINAGRLGLPLVMDRLSYSPGDVSTATAFAGLATLPFAYMLGSLSDRFSRKNILVLGYLLAGVGALLLMVSVSTWQFWLASALLLISVTVSGSVAAAFATDLLSRDVLLRVLPWLSAVGSLAGILGFALAGLMFETFGFSRVFLGAAVLALAAAAMIWPLRCERQLAAAFEPGWTCDLAFRKTATGHVKASAEMEFDLSLIDEGQKPL